MTLEARLAAPAGLLPEAAESRSDTARIQAAIDACPPGRAVRLTRRGDTDVFLSGPLRLKAGVTLVVDARTALFASRDPRDYDVAPGSCGILAEASRRGTGCKPLILAEDAPGSGVMGKGAIDGRSGAPMRGQELSWWELAKKAKVMDLQQSCPRLLVVRRCRRRALQDRERHARPEGQGQLPAGRLAAVVRDGRPGLRGRGRGPLPRLSLPGAAVSGPRQRTA